jgi:hypothetical protein
VERERRRSERKRRKDEVSLVRRATSRIIGGTRDPGEPFVCVADAWWVTKVT